MTRKTIYYISQLADPNIYDTSVFQKCLGGDNEINWINDQLEKLNLLDSVEFKGVSIERGGMLPNISDIDTAFLGGSYHSVHDHFPWQVASNKKHTNSLSARKRHVETKKW